MRHFIEMKETRKMILHKNKQTKNFVENFDFSIFIRIGCFPFQPLCYFYLSATKTIKKSVASKCEFFSIPLIIFFFFKSFLSI